MPGTRADGDADGDFAGYVAARWPQLVRTVWLLGCPEQQAADVVLDALARCQRGWSRTSGEADVDGVVRAELVASWERRRSGTDAWWVRADPRAASGRSGPVGYVAGVLDGLNPAERTALVLDRYVAAPGGSAGPVLPSEPTAEQLRTAAELVPVLAPPSPDQITTRRRQDSRRRTRRGLRLALATVVPLLVVAAGLTWLADRSPRASPDNLAALAITRVENPTNVVWEAGGVLHLPHGTAPVPVLRQVAPAGTGALYADQDGRVVELRDDGVRTVLGHEDLDVGFVSSDTRGWAAWVDPTGDTRQVVVYDVSADRVVRRLDVADDVRLVAIDGDAVYLTGREGVRGWHPRSQLRPASVVEPASLVDVTSATRVYQAARTRLQMFPYFGIVVPVTGVGGRLSADGKLLATRTSGEAGGDGPVAIYNTATGDSLQTGVADDELALDVTLGPDQTVTYLIARKVDRPQGGDQLRASFAGALQLRTCRLFLAGDVPATCDLVTDIPVSGISPMLAH